MYMYLNNLNILVHYLYVYGIHCQFTFLIKEMASKVSYINDYLIHLIFYIILNTISFYIILYN